MWYVVVVPDKTSKIIIELKMIKKLQIKNRRFYPEQYIKLSTYGQDTDGNKQKTLRSILQTCKFHSTCNQDR